MDKLWIKLVAFGSLPALAISLDVIQIDYIVHERISDESYRRMDFKFNTYIAAMSGNNVCRNEQLVYNFFVRHPVCMEWNISRPI